MALFFDAPESAAALLPSLPAAVVPPLVTAAVVAVHYDPTEGGGIDIVAAVPEAMAQVVDCGAAPRAVTVHCVRSPEDLDIVVRACAALADRGHRLARLALHGSVRGGLQTVPRRTPPHEVLARAGRLGRRRELRGVEELDLAGLGNCVGLCGYHGRGIWHGVRRLVLPPTMRGSFGPGCFLRCDALEDVVFPAQPGPPAVSPAPSPARSPEPELFTDHVASSEEDEEAFSNYDDDHLPDSSADAMPPAITSFGLAVFSFCSALRTVDVSACRALRSFGDFTFRGCSGLTTVDARHCRELRALGTGTFDGCAALTEVRFDHCGALSAEAFSGDRAAFAGCTKLGRVVAPAALVSDIACDAGLAVDEAVMSALLCDSAKFTVPTDAAIAVSLPTCPIM